MSPEECSAEILKVLYGYLPPEIRNDESTGTVITVPAAFNQMQKDATKSAAEMAGLGMVALMQEPVAAVMSVMQNRKSDGIFLIYDLGGGTLDIAIAESISGRVSLLSHGGIAMCGGRDFDRMLLDNVVKPWLHDNFELPEDLSTNPRFKQLIRMTTWAAEKAKIELSSREETVISLSEVELRTEDLSGAEIYLDIPLNQDALSQLIAPRIEDSISAVRETLEKAHLEPSDIERLVFVGGPTHYQPLRDRVAFELGIAASTEVNPMTAVAEGAAVFAESIEWKSKSRGRKSTRGALNSVGALPVSLNYVARTPATKSKIAVVVSGNVPDGCEFQVDSLDTGWSSGRISLTNGASVEVSLPKAAENTFKVFVFDSNGMPLKLEQDKLIITRTAASVDAIPSSSSIGIEVLSKLGGPPVLEYLVREGDALPKNGKVVFRASESLRGGSSGALNLKIWEGEIEDPIGDNRFVGVLSIKGTDFDQGTIQAGDPLECEYEILDSGNVVLEVSVASIGGTFHSGRNFYSRQAGQIDYSSASAQVEQEVQSVSYRLDEMSKRVDDPKLDQARDKLDSAITAKDLSNDAESAKQAMDDVLEAKKCIAEVRKRHLKEIRQMDLDNCLEYFEGYLREFARDTEVKSYLNLGRTAQRAIDKNSSDFETHLDELKGRNWQILWRQDWFVVDRFKSLSEEEHLFPDRHSHAALVKAGIEALNADDMDRLRQIVGELFMTRMGSAGEDDLTVPVNIVRG
jgi:molecular chaperone DnaK